MSWTSALFLCYLLGMAVSFGLLARPMARVLGTDYDTRHGDAETRSDAHLVWMITTFGVALLWPLSLTMFTVSRFLAQTGADADAHEVDDLPLLAAQRYGEPAE